MTNNQPKHILISLLGKTPQILTETLYALMVQQKIPISGVRVLTTEECLPAITANLLDSNSGKFYRFCRDWQIDSRQIKFNAQHILVAEDLGEKSYAPPDARQCEPLVNLILTELRALTSDPDTVLHCSLAGGRKTMSVYFAYALQFFGRGQDRLYHVLVQPQAFQNHQDFFYIPPQPQDLITADGNQISTATAKIELIEVPYIRLRDRLAYLFNEKQLSFEKLVTMTQNELAQMPNLPPLEINLVTKRIKIGNRQINLSPIELAIYQYYAERTKNRPDDISVKSYHSYFEYAEGPFFPEAGLKRLLTIYRGIAPYGTVERFEKTLDKGSLTFERACQYFSRIKRKIQGALQDDELAEYYIVSAVGRYRKCYGIKVDGAKIRIVGGIRH